MGLLVVHSRWLRFRFAAAVARAATVAPIRVLAAVRERLLPWSRGQASPRTGLAKAGAANAGEAPW